MDNEDRRKNDEAFRLKIIEQNGEIKALQAQTNTEIHGLSRKVDEQAIKIANIESALWGYPASENAGLLEKNRNQNRKWALLLFFANVLAWGVISLIKPVYEKWIVDWIYNSPSERYLRDTQRPRVKIYHVHPPVEPSE